MEAINQALEAYERVSLTEAVFAILLYYRQKSESSMLDLTISPLRLQVLCSNVTDNTLSQCPFAVWQAIKYIR